MQKHEQFVNIKVTVTDLSQYVVGQLFRRLFRLLLPPRFAAIIFRVHRVFALTFAAGVGLMAIAAEDGSGVTRLVMQALPSTKVASAASRSLSSNGESFTGRVRRIIDGDTFLITSADVRVHVWGLDAPRVNEPGGSVAVDHLHQLTGVESLTCHTRGLDRDGVIQGQCFLPDGRDIAAAMLASGSATEHCLISRNHYRTC